MEQRAPLSRTEHRLTTLLLIAIMALAAWLRLGDLGLVEFKQDEVNHMRLAEAVLDGQVALTGSSASVGIPKPPGMTYLMAIPRAISRDPRVASGFIALLNLGAVFVCYRIGKRYFCLQVGLLAAFLYAVNPWAIIYARKVFTADVLPPFVALALGALLAGVVERRNRAWFWACIWMAALLQITFSPVALIPAFGLIVLIYRRRVHWPSLLAGMAVAALSFVPYLYAGARQGFLRVWESASLGGQGSGASPWYAAFAYASQLASGGNLHALAGDAYGRFLEGRLPGQFLDTMAQIISAISRIYLVWCTLIWWRRRLKDAAPYVIVTIWTWVPLLFDTLPWTNLYPHYMVVLYPAIFMAMAIAISRLVQTLVAARRVQDDVPLRPMDRPPTAEDSAPTDAWQMRGKALLSIPIVALVLLIALWQVYNVRYLHAFVDRQAIDGGYGLPAHYSLDAAQRLESLARTIGTSDALVVTDSYDTRLSQTPAVLDYLLGGRLTARYLDGGESLAFPSSAKSHVLLLWPTAGASASEWIARYGQEQVELALPLRDGEGIVRYYIWPTSVPAELSDLPLKPTAGLVWTNGIELLGGDVLETSVASLRWMIAWRVNALPSDADYHWFNQLVGPDGRKIGQVDGVGFASRNWRQGETVLTWFEMPLSAKPEPGHYTMLVGMYAYPDIRNVTVMDIAGNPAGEYISLGPITFPTATP